MDIESEIVQGFDFKNVIDSFSAIMYSPRDFDIIFYRVSQTHETAEKDMALWQGSEALL